MTRVGRRKEKGGVNRLYDSIVSERVWRDTFEILKASMEQGDGKVHEVYSSSWRGEGGKFGVRREYDSQGSGGYVFSLDSVVSGDLVLAVGGNTVSDAMGMAELGREGRERGFGVVAINAGMGMGIEGGTR